jgi:hypothetical protein
MMEKREKNKDKEASYRLAYAMINDALRKDCPLQAITIEESILADRLWSTLNCDRTPKEKIGSLGQALDQWRPERLDKNGNPIPANRNAALFDQEMDDICYLIRHWWNERNVLLHGIVKSPQGEGPKVGADDFRPRAYMAALAGLYLSNKVKNWVSKKVRAKAGTSIAND